MLRTFKTNLIRKTEELSDCLWDFTPLVGDLAGKNYKMLVPSCWEIHPDFVNFRGKGQYSRTFTAGGNVRLVFKGVSHTANVYVDDKFVKTHYNAYTPFDVIVKDLAAGEHTLRVEVDNQFSEDSTLHIENDYFTYGGINRAVACEELGAIYIKRIHFTPAMVGGDWKATVKVWVENLSDKDISGEVKINLHNTSGSFGEATFKAGSVCELCADFSFADVVAWNTLQPSLYKLNAVLSVAGNEVDDLIEQVGFREISLDGNKLLINGKRMRIKGFNRHEDHANHGCALPYSVMHHDITLMRDMNANSVRTCHYPNDEIFLDLCDELGLLVWEESHARGFTDIDMARPNFDEQNRLCIEEMITEHYNHPSIYIWGVLNECISQKEPGASQHKMQLEQVAELDQSRPNTFASNKHFKDICFAYPTVISNNMYPQWYFNDDVAEYLQRSIDYANENSGEIKPFIVSEIGCGGIYGSHNKSRAKWTEEGQCDIIERQITPILDNTDCTGVYIWQFCDVRVTDEWAMKRPRTHNNKGLVDEFRREKMAYYTVKEVFAKYSDFFE